MDVQFYMWHLNSVYENTRISHTVKICLSASDFSTEIILLKRELQEARKKLLGTWVTFYPEQAF